MTSLQEIKLPDIGDFEEVEVIEILVNAGDEIAVETSIITLESDKASIDIPSPLAGIVKEIHVNVGDKISEGALLISVDVKDGTDKEQETETSTNTETSENEINSNTNELDAEVLVLGSGPGGYTAAFRAADLGKKTILVERYDTLGGVCLNVGCIPSKALLHVAKVISDIEEMKEVGIDLGEPNVDINSVRQWTESVINKLTGGLKQMAGQRKVTTVHGVGHFTSSNTLEVTGNNGVQTITFDHAIIAAGSQASMIPGLPDDDRILDSTSALLLNKIPERLLVIGGGIIGLEMATVYEALGSKITIVEMLDGLMAGADKDLVRPFQKHVKKRYQNIYLKTAVTSISADPDKLTVTFEGDKAPASDEFDAVLVAVGRRPNGHNIGAENAGIHIDERGFIPVDNQQRTNIANIFAIGDIVGQPMLAHKATHEGKVAAEVIAGLKSAFDANVIPSVAYTDPEVAWVGVTELQAKENKINYGKGVFPWAASGRSLSLGRDEGMTKVLFDKDSKRIIGAGIVGPNAGDLIAEATLAIEMGCDAEDIGLTIHPHPTLSETVAMAAEVFEGTITDLYIPKK